MEDTGQQVPQRLRQDDGVAYGEDVPEVAGGHRQTLILRGPRRGAGWGTLPHAVQRLPGGGTGHYGKAQRDGKERRPPGICG